MTALIILLAMAVLLVAVGAGWQRVRKAVDDAPARDLYARYLGDVEALTSAYLLQAPSDDVWLARAKRAVPGEPATAASMDFTALLKPSPPEDIDPGEHVREILARMEPSRPPAGPRTRLSRFLLILAGIMPEAAAKAPGERVRLEGIGAAILVNSVLASVSMWFSLGAGAKPPVSGLAAAAAAVCYGLIILWTGQWLVSAPAPAAGKWAWAAPRLVLAVLLGALISTPLVLRVFQPGISAQMTVMWQESSAGLQQYQHTRQLDQLVVTARSELRQLHNVISSHGAAPADPAADPELVGYKSQLAQLQGQLSNWNTAKALYQAEDTCQRDGGAGCPPWGAGPAAQAHDNNEYALQQAGIVRSQISNVRGEIRQRDQALNARNPTAQRTRYQEAELWLPLVQVHYDKTVKRRDHVKAIYAAQEQVFGGIATRLQALREVAVRDAAVGVAALLLFVLFLVFECLPVTVKLLEAPNYEKVLARELDRRQKITLIQERLQHQHQHQHQAPGWEDPRSPARGPRAADPALAAGPAEAAPLTVTDRLSREIETIYPFRDAGERTGPGYGEQLENLFFAISPAVDHLLRDGYTTSQVIEAVHAAADMLIPYLDAMQQAALTSGK